MKTVFKDLLVKFIPQKTKNWNKKFLLKKLKIHLNKSFKTFTSEKTLTINLKETSELYVTPKWKGAGGMKRDLS